MKRKIPWDDLSKTFRDAIHITRKLGFRYLWIDSLCIVQDDPADWKVESANMGSIYRQGILNIAAIESDTPGCFEQRKGVLNRPCRLDIDVPDQFLPVLNGGPIHALPPQKLGAEDRAQGYRGPLDSRAWVLQEYMLARRTLNFGKNMIFWDCLAMAASESVPDGLETGERTLGEDNNFVQDFKNGVGGKLTQLDNPQSKDGQIFSRAWFLTVEAYTRRDITYESDRLTALAGVAVEYQKTVNDVYLAGLWKRNILDGLLWSIWAKGCPTAGNSVAQKGDHGPPGKRYRDFKAPSWSWASVCGYTRYFERYGHDERIEQRIIAEVEEARCMPSVPSEVSHCYNGFITIRSQLRKAIIRIADPVSVDWNIQRQSDAAFNVRSTTEDIEKLHSAPLPTLTRSQMNDKTKMSRPEDSTMLEPNTKAPSDPSSANVGISATNNSKSLQTHSKVTLPDGMLQAFAPGIDPDELQSAIHVRKDGIALNVHALNRWGEKTVQGLLPGEEGGITLIDVDHTDAVEWPIHTLLDPQTGQTIGLWAPDISGGKKPEHDTKSRLEEVSCLAISQRKQYIWCLGLVPATAGNADEYERAGLAYLDVKHWDMISPEPPLASVKII